MKLKEKSLSMINILYIKIESEELLVSGAELLRDFAVEKDLYPTGPTMYTIDINKNIEIGIPINEKIRIDEGSDIFFADNIEFDRCLYFRCIDEDEDVKKLCYQLFKYAEQQKMLHGNKCYNFVLDVYGEVVTDVYLPIK